MDKAKCLFCNYWVAKNKFDRHTKKCVKRTQKCGYCRTPSHKSDMPAHEKRCMQKYQYIKNAEGSKFCKICKRTFANRTNAMIHIGKAHPNWQKIPIRSLPKSLKKENEDLSPNQIFEKPYKIEVKREVNADENSPKMMEFLKCNKDSSNLKIIVDERYIFYTHKRLLAKYSAVFNSLLKTSEAFEEIHSNCGWKTMSDFTT